MEHCLAPKREEIPTYVTMIMNSEDIVLSQISQTGKDRHCWISPYRRYFRQSSSDTRRKVIARGWQERQVFHRDRLSTFQD